jgi:hypothetical protein
MLARSRIEAHDCPMSKPSPLDDPATAAFAWSRFRRMMRWMLLATITVVIGAMSLLYKQEGMVSVHFYIAIAVGLSFTMLLMSALMGLVFLSNGTGHDASANNSEDPD